MWTTWMNQVWMIECREDISEKFADLLMDKLTDDRETVEWGLTIGPGVSETLSVIQLEYPDDSSVGDGSVKQYIFEACDESGADMVNIRRAKEEVWFREDGKSMV